MAKIKKSLQTLSGKMGEVVYVDNGSHGSYVRRAVAAGSKKEEAALKGQYSRTAFLNGVASDLNTVVRRYAGILKPNHFYQDVQCLLRKEPADNRFLVLQQLKGMEVSKAYPLARLGAFTYKSRYGRNALTVELATTAKPVAGKFGADCYCYSVILLLWQEGKEEVHDSCQLSEWVAMRDKAPGFEFVFKRPAKALHWLVCVHLQLGQHERRIENVQAEGMQITDAGSFDKMDLQLLEQRQSKAVRKEKQAVEVQRRVKRKR